MTNKRITKQPSSTLRLNRESIRNLEILSVGQLAAIAGGFPTETDVRTDGGSICTVYSNSCGHC